MSERGVTTITLKQINKEKVYQYIYRTKKTSDCAGFKDGSVYCQSKFKCA